MAPSSCIYGSGIAFTNSSTIQGAGSIGDSNPMPITNTGTIIANNTSSPLVINPNANGFTNTGTLTVVAHSTLNILGLFNNLSANGTLTGGTYNVAGVLGVTNHVITNAASISLTGTGAEIFNNGVNALSTLAANTSQGILSLNGGQMLTSTSNFSNARHVTVGTASGFTVHGYTQIAGTTTVDGTLTAHTGLMLQHGILQGEGTIASAVDSQATVTAGDSTSQAGKLTISGSYTQGATGILNIAIGGTQVGTQYSQLAVSNGASLNGTLNISLINHFLPTLGSVFTILTANPVTGQFSTVHGLGINSGEHFEIAHSSSGVTLTVASGP